jgi:hypothetical protein
MLPMDDVQIETLWMSNVGLGKASTRRINLSNLFPFKTAKVPAEHTWLSQLEWPTTEEMSMENEDLHRNSDPVHND